MSKVREKVAYAVEPLLNGNGTKPRIMASDAPELVTIPNVEIVSTGSYHLASPGDITITTDMLAEMVEAQEDPMIKSPRLKIGHTTDFGDGEPSFGKLINMRLTAEGQTIVGDYVGVPRWLAEIMPAAYPSRSIEAGAVDHTDQNGKKYEYVISAVALLGVIAPGVSSIEDLAGLYGAEQPEGTEIVAGTEIIARIGGDAMPELTATVEETDVRRQYYESLSPDQAWWWIRAMELDPNALIVDDDDGHLFRVPFTINGDEIAFEDPEEVEIVYTPVGEKVNAARIAAGSGRRIAVFASRSEARPETTEEEDRVELSPAQLKRLGLSEDASQEDVDAKFEELTSETPPTPGEGDPPPAPTDPPPPAEGDDDEEQVEEGDEEQQPAGAVASDGTVRVDAETLRTLSEGAARGSEVATRMEREDRERFIAKAIEDGKIPPARREHWDKQFQKDPEGTRETIASFPANLIPLKERGEAPSDDSTSVEAYPSDWLSAAEQKRLDQARNGNRDRVTQEAKS